MEPREFLKTENPLSRKCWQAFGWKSGSVAFLPKSVSLDCLPAFRRDDPRIPQLNPRSRFCCSDRQNLKPSRMLSRPLDRPLWQPLHRPLERPKFDGGNTDPLAGRITDGLIADWAFAEGAGRSVVDLTGGGNDINLDLPTSPNDSWVSTGIATAAGLIQTPTMTAARTVVLLCKVPFGADDGFTLSGGNASGSGIIPPGYMPESSGFSYRIGFGGGVFEPWYRPTGQNGYELYHGGWYLLVQDFGQAYNTPLGIGGRHSTDSSRISAMDTAYLAVYDRVLTDAECDQLYLLSRRLLKSRGAYLDPRDCPVRQDLLAIWGQSNAEGRAAIADLSPEDQADTSPAGAQINRKNARTLVPLVLGSTQQSDAPSEDFGPEMGAAWAAAADGSPLWISKHAIGGTRLALGSDGSTWNTGVTPRSDGYLKEAFMTLWAARAQMMAQGIGPRTSVFWMQGENDAVDLDFAEDYQQNLIDLIAKAREQMAENIPFIIGRIRDQDPLFDPAAAVLVRDAQEFVGEGPNCGWIDTDALSLEGDDVHYDAAGMKSLGTLVYDLLP